MKRILTTLALAATLVAGPAVGGASPAQAAVTFDIPADPCVRIYCPPPVEDPCQDAFRQLDIWKRWADYLTGQVYQERNTSELLRGDVAWEQFKRGEDQANLATWRDLAWRLNGEVQTLRGKVARKQETINRLRARLAGEVPAAD